MKLLGVRDRILYLRTLAPFADLSAQDLGLLAGAARESWFRSGQVLLREDEPIETIWLIVEGSVHVTRQGAHIAHFGPSSAVGAFGMLARADEGVQAVADSDGYALCIDAEALLEGFEDSFSITIDVLRSVARTLIRVRSQIPEHAGMRAVRPDDDGAVPNHLDMVQRMFTLRHALPWGDTGLTALAQLARRAQERRLEPGEVLWHAGDRSTHMLVLAGGVVKCHAPALGQCFYFTQHGTAGPLDALADQHRWYSATALSPSLGLVLRWEDFLDVLEDQVDLAIGTMVVMARELLFLAEQFGIDLAAQTRPGFASAPTDG